jgi:DNA-directed RNA polymerase subunit RPC12/RpoP
MKKYECPHCGEKTITPMQKAFAGTQKSKGVVCPNCGTHCTNGMESSVFRCVVSAIVCVVSIISYIKCEANISAIVIALSLLSGFVITRIFDALFYPLAVSLRMDLK